jgi:hypothetical protein
MVNYIDTQLLSQHSRPSVDAGLIKMYIRPSNAPIFDLLMCKRLPMFIDYGVYNIG